MFPKLLLDLRKRECLKLFENVRSSHQEVFLEKVFWKYPANLQENTHAEVRFR